MEEKPLIIPHDILLAKLKYKDLYIYNKIFNDEKACKDFFKLCDLYWNDFDKIIRMMRDR